MNFKIALAAMPILLLGACSQDADVADEEIVEEEVVAAPVAGDGGPTAGAYEVVNAAGETVQYVLDENGTYTLTAGDESSSGSYIMGADGPCLDPDGDEEGEVCYISSAAAEDGTWTTTAPDGSVSTVRRIMD